MNAKEILKETYPGSGDYTHSHWVDEDDNVIPAESMVIPTTEFEKLKKDTADLKACLNEILMGGVV